MKTLYLVRHAKSNRDDPTLPDRERPLNDRGREDAPKAGKRLARRGAKPELIVSSPAVRALTTAQLIADEVGYERRKILADDSLYGSNATDLLAFVRGLGKELDHVMLVGHNPEFTDFAHLLAAEIDDMPTCAVAEFRYDTKAWKDIGAMAPSEVSLDEPKKK